MNKNSHVCTMTAEQAEQLRQILQDQNWELDTVPYAIFRARKNKTTVTAYESGKVTIQGRGTAELVQFTIEPQILMEARFGYETELAREEQPEMFEPHAGIDESGKGDFFGPMVIACVYVDERSAEKLHEAGVQDSKAIKSDKRIKDLAQTINQAVRGKSTIVTLGPEAYNRMYDSMGNVNRILAWGHARALENLLEKQPDCPRALSDQFAAKRVVLSALLERGKQIQLEQRTKAESDIAVAAASILARHQFVIRMQALSEQAGITLLRGASQKVLEQGVTLVKQHGEAALGNYAKLHFRTSKRVLALADGQPDPAESTSTGEMLS